MLLTIYNFFEYTILANILLSIIIYITMIINKATKAKALIFSLIPTLLIISSIILAGFTYSFYPAAISGHGFSVLFLYIPFVFLIIYFFTEKKKRDRKNTLKIYTGVAILFFILSVIYHPVPSGPSASNGWDDGDLSYSCEDRYYLIERTINLFMIDCSDKLFKWAEKNKTHICEINRESKDKISITDTQDNEYLFDGSCEFKRKIFY